ncbi:MAG: peptidoglycan-binding domain-containing protein [Merismopediaceae bacterium]|nr:peptidoglycan-binding domain-containing protein [Merismopediaceae bacterium]
MLGFVTKVGGVIEVDPSQRKWILPVGFFLLSIGLVITFKPTSPVSNCPYVLDRVGSVADWQNLLNGSGYGPLEVTDEMDEVTKTETKRFQKDLGLAVTGSVDSGTWNAGVKHKKLPEWLEQLPNNCDKK